MLVNRRGWAVVALWAVVFGPGSARGQSDRCAEAPPLVLGTLTGSFSGMTPDGADLCHSPTLDVWYRFTAPRDGVLFLDACPSPGFPVISVHTGCPGTAANQIACNHRDSYHCNEKSHLEVSCVAGVGYLVRIGGSGTYSVSAWFEGPRGPVSRGPDVVSGDIPEVRRYPDAGGFAAFAYGSTACNIGDVEAVWTNQNNSNQHPVISTGLYRVKDGVFEQLGVAWLKHGWASGTETFCDYCPQTGVLPVLLPGCSDSYDVPQNGTQQILGRRSEVNPTTGIFPYPPVGNPPIADSTSRRIRVVAAAVDPGVNPGAVYLGELQYVAADDARAGHALNNASYRPMRFPTPGATPVFTGPVARTKPAIVGWAELDPGASVVPLDFTEDGYACRVWVGSKVRQLSPGAWLYEYVVFNLNADRAVAGLVLPRAAGVEVSSVQVRSPAVQGDDVYSLAPWEFVGGAGEMGWMGAQTYEENPDGNAVRWGTAYTMLMVAGTGPVEGVARVPLFRPGRAGDPGALTLSLPVPGAGPCIADFNGDGFLDQFDYDGFVAAFETGAWAADVNGDTFLDFFDYDAFVGAFTAGC